MKKKNRDNNNKNNKDKNNTKSNLMRIGRKRNKNDNNKNNNRDNDKTRSKSNNNNDDMSPEHAAELIKQPYITEKTFNMIEKENKLTFIVSDRAKKKNIAESLESLYGSEVSEVNTSRTVRGKKAMVKFETPEGARDLATKLGLV